MPARPQQRSMGSAMGGGSNPFLVGRYANGTATSTYNMLRGWFTDPRYANIFSDPAARAKKVTQYRAGLGAGEAAALLSGTDMYATPPAPTMNGPEMQDILARAAQKNLTINDLLFVQKNFPQDKALSTAINRTLAGFPFEYTPTPVTPPTTTPPPATNPPPTADLPGPQVIQYGGDVWKNLPVLKYLNGQWSQNQFMTPSGRASYDPATETALQAPGSFNAKNLMDIDRDPVARTTSESIFTRHNRSYEKELADAIANAPMGNASRYVRTG